MWGARCANGPPGLTLAPAECWSHLQTVDESPAIKHVDPIPVVTPCAALETAIRHVVPVSAVTKTSLSPAPAVYYATPAPPIEFVTPSPVIEYSAPAPSVTCFTPSPQLPLAYTMADLITGFIVDTTRSVNSQSPITDVGASASHVAGSLPHVETTNVDRDLQT